MPTTENKSPLLSPPPVPPGSIPSRLRPHIGKESSWASLIRIVRKEDGLQIQQCQEKLNAYVVFSGIFSITLSVLLVDSFRNLRPNYAAMTVELLKQISTQGHSTNVPAGVPSLPYYLPPRFASHVNTLWVASLSLNVVGVSFVFLYKEWLHQLEKSVGSSPQAELRIRHSRQADWGLVELAPLLPFVLQISMALFFAGLCILTFAVNQTAGYTTMTVVVGWAGIFVLMVVAPIISPQCPYRLPFAESATCYVRSSIHGFLAAQAAAASGMPSPAKKVNALEAGVARTQAGGGSEVDELDIDVFLAIYSKRCEVHILNIMWDALKEAGASPENLLLFVRKIIDSAHPPISSLRDGSGRDSKLDTPVAALDLRSVPNATYCTILDNVANLLDNQLLLQSGANDSKPIEWSAWMKEALWIIFADSPYPIPAGANTVLAKLLHEERSGASVDCIISLVSSSSSAEVTANHFAFIFQRIQGVMMIIPTANVCPFLSTLLRSCFSPQSVLTPNVSNDLQPLLKDLQSKIPPSCLTSITSLLMTRFTNEVHSTMFWHRRILGLFESLLIVDDALSKEAASPAIKSTCEHLVKMMRQILVQPKNVPIVMSFASGLTNNKHQILVRSATRLFIDAFATSTPATRQCIVSNLTSAIDWQYRLQTEDEDNSWDRFVRLHVTKTYLLVLKGIEELQKRGSLLVKDSEAEGAFKNELKDLEVAVKDSISLALDRSSESESESSTKKTNDMSTGKEEDDAAPKAVKDGDDDKQPYVSNKTEHARDHDGDVFVPLPPPKIRFEKDIDMAKQCLLQITALDLVTAHAGAIDNNRATETEIDDASLSLCGDDIIEALLRIVPLEDLGLDASARMRRVAKAKKTTEDHSEAKDEEGTEDTADSEGESVVSGYRKRIRSLRSKLSHMNKANST
ncbi:hypothetical protein BDY19DRAFT_902893 [Irpex rosettiformis]|uniref:Uncharacterized protein n=1 Tax=Irpex rosettiformis TaxID=378272 RepID=A0ACB8UFP9_9APHY|nr:hypothetical protein BDY19DRAFT_902893 [Irpex rosettiformis]